MRREEQHDIDGRLKGITSGSIQNLQYAFDANDQITNVVNGWNQQYGFVYGYDLLGRLNTFNKGGSVNVVDGLDASGNRISPDRTDAAGLAAQVHTIAPDSNRLTGITGSATIEYQYDGRGNRSWTHYHGVHIANYAYDSFNRLASIGFYNGATTVNTAYLTNALDQRVAKTRPGLTARYVYARQNDLLAENNNGQWTSHIYMDGAPLAMVRNNAIYYVHTDHQGRAEALTGTGQQVVWRGSLDPYNTVPVIDSVGGYNLGFPGQYWDSESGLWHGGMRTYDPLIGRFLESDPSGLAGGLNTYSYAAGNPVSFTDSSGMACNERGCWNTAAEFQLAAAGDYAGYYQMACSNGDPYACRGHDVSTQTQMGDSPYDDYKGLLALGTHMRLVSNLNGNIMMCPDDFRAMLINQALDKIRKGLVRARIQQLAGASPGSPRMVSKKSISDFHHDVFEQNGANGSAFGGDYWDSLGLISRSYNWCESPACYKK